jgi:hypothetical protein
LHGPALRVLPRRYQTNAQRIARMPPWDAAGHAGRAGWITEWLRYLFALVAAS